MCKKLLTTFLLFVPAFMYAQANLQAAKNDLIKVNSVFDSSQYVGFTATFRYSTDTVAGKFEQQQKTAQYYLNKKHFYMSCEGIEHIQNDSFAIEIDNNEKTLIVTPNINGRLSDNFKLKDFLNQSLDIYSNIYTISITDIDTFTRETKFVTSNPASPYSEFAIRYDTSGFLPISMHFTLSEKLPFEIKSGTGTKELKLKQRLDIYFSDFGGIPDPAMFNEKKYMRYDIASKKYEPSMLYKDFRFYSLGFEEDPNEIVPDELTEATTEAL